MLEPGLLLEGVDISTYALKNAHEDIKDNLTQLDARRKFPYKDNEFDLVLSLGTLHNFNICELEISLGEINRVGKSAYIMVESYRNDRELFNLQCWALTCETFFSPKEWEWAFKKFQYSGDFEFIYFE
jgi:ubiquinone/menaquinone biosynthesis C-methylase UbiE